MTHHHSFGHSVERGQYVACPVWHPEYGQNFAWVWVKRVTPERRIRRHKPADAGKE